MTAVVGEVKPEAGLQLRSLVKGNGELELSLVDVPVPEPGPDEVLIRIEAIAAYGRRATGEKYLINPALDA